MSHMDKPNQDKLIWFKALHLQIKMTFSENNPLFSCNVAV